MKQKPRDLSFGQLTLFYYIAADLMTRFDFEIWFPGCLALAAFTIFTEEPRQR